MTYFLDAPTTPAPRRNPDLKLSDNWSGLGAAVEQGWQAADVGAQRSRQIYDEQKKVAMPAAERLGLAALNERFNQRAAERNPAMVDFKGLTPDPTSVDEFFKINGLQASEIALELAREKAAAEPDAWKDLDLSPEGIEARVTDQRKKELEENQQIIAMSPNPGRNAVLGEIGAAIADPINLALAPFGGGGGSLLRIMGGEALVNATAEAAQFPARQRVAKELGQPAPDFLESVTLGAVGGAALGGVFHGVGRAVEYFKTRSRVHVPVGESPINSALAANAAEDALIVGDDPIEAARAVVRKIEAPYLLENPINPTRPPLISEAAPVEKTLTPSDMVAQGIPPVETTVLPPIAGDLPQGTDELVAAAQRAIDASETADSVRAKPLIGYLRDNHRVTKAQTKAAEKAGRPAPTGGESLQIDPSGPLGGELKAQGITPKTQPGLFKKGGRTDLDNLVASEMEEQFPGIMEATRTPYGSDYLDQQGVIDLIIRDANGDSTWLRSRADAQKAQADLDAFLRQAPKPADLFQAQARAPGGLFIDKNAYEFTDGFSFADAIEADVNAYLDREWAAVAFTPAERREILETAAKSGGDIEYLAQSVLSREADYVDLPKHEVYPHELPDEAIFGNAPASGSPDARGGGAGAAGEQNAGATGGGRADQAGGDRAVEQTDAGEQSLIPGVKPITQRQRLEAAQQRVLGGGAREADSQIGGLFDPGAKSRTDLFSDPMTPAAREFDARRVNDLREEALVGGFGDALGLKADDGRVLDKLDDVLNEIDEMDALEREIAACRLGKAPE